MRSVEAAAASGVASSKDVAQLLRDYLSRVLSRSDTTALDATILRTGSLSARDLPVWHASAGQLRFASLVEELERLQVPTLAGAARERLAALDPAWSIRLARVMALQNLLPRDRTHALQLLEVVLGTGREVEVSQRDARVFCDVAIIEERTDLARTWLRQLKLNRSDRLMVSADLANPFGAMGGDLQAWLKLFNEPFLKAKLEPISVRPSVSGEDTTPFDRLRCDCRDRVDGPLVTVIVSCWRPGQQLVTSVESLLAQTWQPIEVIVVDDASPPEFEPVLEQVSVLDSRIRVIRQPANGGTYVARNAALKVARGEFVTFQDSDDWSHPRRIERQACHLLEHPEVIGATGHLMRVTESLHLGLPGSPTIQEALPLFMFRRAPVLDGIGFYDSVRKSADREYIERIKVVFRQQISAASKEPLGIYRLLADSLSRSEFKPGWRHAARNIYKDAFDFWHARIARGEAPPWRSEEVGESTFPAPRRFQVDQARAESDNAYDFVFVGEWRQYGGPQKSMIEEIRALKAAGYRIAICHQEAFRFMSLQRKGNCTAIRELIHEGMVDEVALSDRLQVSVLILRYPPILQFVRHESSAWKVSRAMVVANQAPCEHDGSDVRYRVNDCIENFRHLFGIDATWMPQGPLIRDVIAPRVPPMLLATRDLPGIVDLAEWLMPARRAVGTLPVVGRYSRDNMMKFPATVDELLQCYPADPDIDIRIMGGANCCPEILGERPVPENWTLLPYNDMPVPAFLATLDFFVYFDNDQIVEAFGRSILEALASGLVVILPEKFRRVFDEAAVYARPGEVAGLVCALHEDRDRYQAQAARGLNHVRKHFSRESYADRMASWLVA